jgi:queuine tRNA-ribosyltransferase
MFELFHSSSKSKARAGRLLTRHGTIETPVFMPVGTLATVKAVKQRDLRDVVKAQVILGNTYHLYLRPGCDIIERAGGLHRFMNWDGPILTDSGGYQVYSLASSRKVEEQSVTFKSHLDGSSHKFTPENVAEIQRTLGSDIMMVLDECPPWPCTYSYAKNSMDLTHRWAVRGKKAFEETTPVYGHLQMQFGICQGSTYQDLRAESARYINDLDFNGNAIGGLSVGEPTELMYEMTDHVTGCLPANKPRYLMGVGTPGNLLQCISLGIDMFDCVMPTRNARNGMLFTRNGIINMRNAKWKYHFASADPEFESELCSEYSMAYMHHLFRCGEILGMQLATLHNLQFYNWLMKEAGQRIRNETFDEWFPGMILNVENRL